MKYKLATSSWDEKEKKALYEVIESNFFTMGAKTLQFENDFSNYINVKYSVMVNSGSSANLLMVAALLYSKKFSLDEASEVIVPAVSWSTTYFPFHQCNFKIRFVDIDKETFNIGIKEIISGITNRTKIICAVNLLGNPCEYDELINICKEKNIILLEDNCESLGAKYKNQIAGSFGLMSTHSFFFSHHISTMEGGMISTNDEELYQILLSLRAHGWTRNLPQNNLITNKKNNNEFYELFNFILPGYNLRPIELEAAVGIKQLEKIDTIVSNRRKNAEYFKNKFQESKIFKLQTETGESSWFGFGVKFKKTDVRNYNIEIYKNCGIECRPIVAGNFTKNPVIKYLKYTIHGELVNSNYIHDYGIFFGNSHEDLTLEIDYLHEMTKEFK